MFPSGPLDIPSGRSVKIDDKHWAFVPAPLPPAIGYSGEMVSVLTEAYGEVRYLDGAALQLPNPDLLVTPYMRIESMLSSEIEGTQTSLGNVLVSEVKGIEDDGTGNIRQVLNHMAAMKQGLLRLPNLPVSLRLIRELHDRLLTGVPGAGQRGEFRQSQVHIGSPHLGIDHATDVPPPPNMLPELLDNWEQFVVKRSSDIPVLVQLAMMHYQFEAIHPFADGNGRIGRLLIVFLLCEREVLRQPLLYLSPYFEAHRSEYFERLLAVSREGDWEGWIGFFLRGVAVQARSAAAYCRGLIDMREQLRNDAQEAHQSANLLTLIDRLFENPVFTVPSIAESLQVTPQTGRNLTHMLQEMGIAQEMDGSAWPRVYWAPQLFEVLEKAAQMSGDTT